MTARTRTWCLVAAGAAIALCWAAVGGGATKSSTTTIGVQQPGSASVKCPRGKTVVAANTVGEANEVPGPSVTINALARSGKRGVKTAAYNFGDEGELTAIARCKPRPRSSLESDTAAVPAATFSGSGEATATAQCPRGTRIVFGGFRAKRDAEAPEHVFIYVTSAMRAKGRRWKVHALNTNIDGSGTVEALAYCGEVGKSTARPAEVALGQFETGSAEAKCQRGTTVLYGGFEQVPGTPGRLQLNAIHRSGRRGLRVTATEGFYLDPGDTMGVRAIAYCG